MKQVGRPPYYITAYGLAVRRGFKGTLDEWLESLRADPLIVNITSEDMVTGTSDRSHTEVYDAISAGRICMGILNSSYVMMPLGFSNTFVIWDMITIEEGDDGNGVLYRRFKHYGTTLRTAETCVVNSTPADGSRFGTVNPAAKTDDMTKPVGVDAEGRLFTAPGEDCLVVNITSEDLETGTVDKSHTEVYEALIGGRPCAGILNEHYLLHLYSVNQGAITWDQVVPNIDADDQSSVTVRRFLHSAKEVRVTAFTVTGKPGDDGVTPYIGENDNWWIGEEDTGRPSRGKDGPIGASGSDGITPHIGENGNWWFGDQDTGKPSRGEAGAAGDEPLVVHITSADMASGTVDLSHTGVYEALNGGGVRRDGGDRN